jgi:hypothetical protein
MVAYLPQKSQIKIVNFHEKGRKMDFFITMAAAASLSLPFRSGFLGAPLPRSGPACPSAEGLFLYPVAFSGLK